MKPNQKSILFASLAIMAWSTVATVFKLTLEEISPLQMIFGASITSALLFRSVHHFNFKKKKYLPFSFSSFVLGLLNPLLYYIVLFSAYHILPAKIAQPINYSWPLFFVLFLAVFQKEKLRLISISGILISLVGLVIIVNEYYQSQVEWNLTGILLALASAVIWASYWLFRIRIKEEQSASLFWGFLAGAIVSGIVLIFTEDGFSFSGRSIWYCAYIGLFEMGIAFLLWQKALSLSSNKALISNLIYLSPIISLFMINKGLGEKITPGILIGLLVIISGIILQKFTSKE
jgi:drug/metabolite transporter (DMT)-like permease